MPPPILVKSKSVKPMFKSINMVNMKQGARKGKERLKPGKPVNSANKKSRHVTSRHVR
jgi:hypothetical protein